MLHQLPTEQIAFANTAEHHRCEIEVTVAPTSCQLSSSLLQNIAEQRCAVQVAAALHQLLTEQIALQNIAEHQRCEVQVAGVGPRDI